MSKQITEETLEAYKNAYTTNNDKGKIFFTLLSLIFKANDKIDCVRLGKDIMKIDGDLINKSNTIQKVMVNRYFTSKLLKLKNDKQTIVVNELSLCNAMIKDEIWLNIISNKVIPLLYQHNYI